MAWVEAAALVASHLWGRKTGGLHPVGGIWVLAKARQKPVSEEGGGKEGEGGERDRGGGVELRGGGKTET